MDKLAALEKLIRQQELDIVSAARHVDSLQKELSQKKDEKWLLEQKVLPNCAECNVCCRRNGILICLTCSNNACFDCVEEYEDDDEIYTVLKCLDCVSRNYTSYIGTS